MSFAVFCDNAPLVRTGSMPDGGEHALDRIAGAHGSPLGGCARSDTGRRPRSTTVSIAGVKPVSGIA